jgi:hypothetical protein
MIPTRTGPRRAHVLSRFAERRRGTQQWPSEGPGTSCGGCIGRAPGHHDAHCGGQPVLPPSLRQVRQRRMAPKYAICLPNGLSGTRGDPSGCARVRQKTSAPARGGHDLAVTPSGFALPVTSGRQCRGPQTLERPRHSGSGRGLQSRETQPTSDGGKLPGSCRRKPRRQRRFQANRQ